MPRWDTTQYSRFIEQRTRPAYDLARRIAVSSPNRIVDVGCGPGNSTRVLRERWPEARISAFDSSREMLERARQSDPEVDWFHARVEEWRPTGRYDVLFSNAALHWVESHDQLLPRLLGALTDDGALAVQIPAHYDSPLHAVLVEVATMPEWKEHTAKARARLSPNPPSWYYDVLAPISTRVDLWETRYFHEMDSARGVLEWFRGAGLRPFLEALPDDNGREAFEREVLNRFERILPLQENGRVLLPFNRLFFIAYR